VPINNAHTGHGLQMIKEACPALRKKKRNKKKKKIKKVDDFAYTLKCNFVFTFISLTL
jgi:hypothetical protein